jgi:hypothetical protein
VHAPTVTTPAAATAAAKVGDPSMPRKKNAASPKTPDIAGAMEETTSAQSVAVIPLPEHSPLGA